MTWINSRGGINHLYPLYQRRNVLRGCGHCLSHFPYLRLVHSYEQFVFAFSSHGNGRSVHIFYLFLSWNHCTPWVLRCSCSLYCPNWIRLKRQWSQTACAVSQVKSIDKAKNKSENAWKKTLKSTKKKIFNVGILGLLSRSSKEGRRAIKVIIDLLAISAQITGFVVWPLLENRPILWMVPVAAIMTSCAWWENYVCIHSPIGFVRAMGRAKEDLKTTRYFNCIFFSLWKIVLFFCSLFIILWLQGEYPMNLFHLFGDAFGPHKITIEEVVSPLNANLPDIIATSQVKRIFQIEWCLLQW